MITENYVSFEVAKLLKKQASKKSVLQIIMIVEETLLRRVINLIITFKQ